MSISSDVSFTTVRYGVAGRDRRFGGVPRRPRPGWRLIRRCQAIIIGQIEQPGGVVAAAKPWNPLNSYTGLESRTWAAWPPAAHNGAGGADPLGPAEGTTPRGDRGCARAPARRRGAACVAPKAVNMGHWRVILRICGRYGACPGPCWSRRGAGAGAPG
jgi:hypothetical protein